MIKQMSRDDEGDDRDKGDNQQLPMPYVSMEEETGKRQGGADKTTYRLWAKTQDKTCHETADADEQPLKHTIEHFKDTCKPHRSPTNTTDESYEYPHIQNDTCFEGTLVRTVIVFVEEINHQRSTH